MFSKPQVIDFAVSLRQEKVNIRQLSALLSGIKTVVR